MLISKSILLSIVLLLEFSVISANLIMRRVPRRHTHVTRSYNSNHPPSTEYEDTIPAAVIEDMLLNINKMDLHEMGDLKSTKNRPAKDLMLLGGVKDYEEGDIQSPKARSVNVRSELDERNTPALADYGNKPRRKTRRRLQQVRKVKVDRSQLDAYVIESEIEATKAPAKEITTKPEEVYKEAQQSYATQTFKRRKGMRDPVVPIIDMEQYVFSHAGNFHYSYEGGDGTKAYERGELKRSNGGAGSAVEGNFSYKGRDGKDYSLQYTADENGYRPVGAHLPTPPPIPPAIKRALEYLATKSTESDFEDVTERMRTRF